MNQNLAHRIRERAYEIWAANGCREGDAEQHWLTAEREILTASAPAIAAARPPTKKAARGSTRAPLNKPAHLAG